jgi:transcriptional regulator of acetoin/glycerol metabolism
MLTTPVEAPTVLWEASSMSMPTVSDDALLKRARRALHDGADLPVDLRSLIRQSWWRSRLSSVEPSRMEIPYRGSDSRSERLRRAAEPVLGRFAQQLPGTHVSIVLADPDARVVGRWAGDRSALHRLEAVSIAEGFVLGEDVAGTNGIGTALEELAPVLIHGAEHYVEPLQRLVCAGVPVRNPLTRRIEGVLNLACPTADANGLLLPTLLDLGNQIERELSARASERERAVFEHFLARSRDTAAPLVALGEHFLLTNAGAAKLLEPSDQALLWDQASEAFSDRVAVVRLFQLSSGAQVQARCTPIRVGSVSVGALIEVTRKPQSARSALVAAEAARHRSRAWTELEQAVRSVDLERTNRLRIVGESGVGKLQLAHRLHRDRNGPDSEPVVIGCGLLAALGPADWLGQVRTALLDEPATLVLTQLNLLDSATITALAEVVDISQGPDLVISTVRTSPRAAYIDGEERFGHVVLRVPPLQERRDDLPDLVDELLTEVGGPESKMSNQAMAALVAARWPGNIRQLAAVIDAAYRAANGRVVDLVHLPEEIRLGSAARRRLSRIEELERDAIAKALHDHRGNKNRVAEALGMSRSTLYRRLRRFGIDADRTVF